MRTMLTDELRKIAGVKLQAIHFEGQGPTRARGREAAEAGAKGSAGGPTAQRKQQRRS
jgi:hypothetical protein